MTIAPELSTAERAKLAEFDAAPEPPEIVVERLRAALDDALEGLQEMLPYVGDYFVEKWDLASYVTRAEAALGHER